MDYEKTTRAFYEAVAERKERKDEEWISLAEGVNWLRAPGVRESYRLEPLKFAAWHSACGAIRALHACGVSGDEMTEAFCTALRLNEPSVMQELQRLRVDISDDKNFAEALYEAVQLNNADAIGMYVKLGGKTSMKTISQWLFDCRLQEDYSRIIHALIAGGAPHDQECMAYLLNSMAESSPTSNLLALLVHADASDMNENETLPAIHAAACHASPENLRLIISAGIAPDMRFHDGDAALHYAHNAATAQELLAAGADINVQNLKAKTPLAELFFGSHAGKKPANILAATSLLMDRGANIDQALREQFKLGFRIFGKTITAFTEYQAQFAEFMQTHAAPATALDLYHLIAAIPASDNQMPLDYAQQVQKIFSHAVWNDKEHAQQLLQVLQEDGMLSAEQAGNILNSIFPPQCDIQQNTQGRMR